MLSVIVPAAAYANRVAAADAEAVIAHAVRLAVDVVFELSAHLQEALLI